MSFQKISRCLYILPRLLFPLLAVAGLILSSVVSAQTSERRILFLSDRDGSLALYTMQPDGTEVERLVESGFEEDGRITYASLSPDGATLAFSSRKDRVGHPTDEIFLLDIATGNVTALTNNGKNNTRPLWSPDSSHIAYLSGFGISGYNSVSLVDVSNPQNSIVIDSDSLRQAIHDDFGPAIIQIDWSPNGQQLVLSVQTSQPNAYNVLLLVNADGTDPRQVTPNDVSMGPAIDWGFHPDIVYAACDKNNYGEICQLNLTTSEILQLTDLKTVLPNVRNPYVSNPVVLSDNEIVFQYGRDDNIYLFNIENQSLVNLTESSATNDIILGWVDLPTTPPTPTPPAATPLVSFVVLGKEGVWLEQDSMVVSGDVGANLASSGPFLAEGSEVTIGIGVEFLSSTSRVLGDSVYVRQGGQVYDVYYNTIAGQGQVLGQQFTPLTLPLVEAFPTVPSFSAGTQNFDVAQGESLTLDAGSYGTLKLRQGATVTFAGGVYDFQEWDLGLSTNAFFAAPSEIRIANRLKVEQGSYVGPAAGTSLDAADIVIYVIGQNGSSGNLGGTPKAAHIGINNTFVGSIYAPNGTLWIRQGSTARGSFLGRWVDIGIGVEVTLESGF